MDYDDTPDEADFRARLRLWLAEHPVVIADDADDTARARLHADWHRALYEGGWVGLSWPVDYGGQGLGPVFEAIANDEVGRAGAPAMPHVGYLGRGILAHGTEEQKRRFLPGLLSGREVWCQGFSEPGAGSDLAALCTRAERTEAGWVVDGQKVWTSDAWIADWCLALVRTDPEAPRHRGISALAIRMDSPGVEVRPLVLSNGDRDFCEVFFDDVVVPTDQLVGEPGQGWALAMGTLGYERGPSDIGFSSRYQALLVSLEREARARSVPPDDEQRRALARAYVSTEVLRLHVLRS
ncbi:MAG: acyl-CoA dehydrogenase family protein, partial [Acidimicrobiales bacterium]|nr:acyl-CoA dehydrogenase family protein [Acidimicrobiales bacterium]